MRLHRVNLALLAIITEGFLSRLSFGLISFALPLYALHLELNLAEIGFLASLNLMVALALKPAAGWAADRFGLKPIFTIAVGLRSLVAFLLIFVGAPWQLYAIRSVHGISESLRDPSVNALIAEHGGKKAIASAFAWYTTAKSLAGSLGKAVAGILLTLSAGDFSLVFALAALLSALPLYTVARYVQERGEGAEESDESALVISPEAVQASTDKKLWQVVLPFVGLGVMISGTASMLTGLLPIMMTEYAGLNEAQAGIIYTISSLVILLAGPLFGWLSDNVSRKLVLLIRSAANTLSSVIYIAVPSFGGFGLGKAVDDIGKAAFRPAWGALLAHVSAFDRRRKARLISYMNMGDDIGGIAAPILAGFLWSAYGLTAVLSVRILLAIITEIYAIALTEPTERQTSYHFAKEWKFMNALNRILIIIGLFVAIGVMGLAIFAPDTLSIMGQEATTLLASNRLPKGVIIAGLMTAVGGLLALELWPRRLRSVPMQQGQAALEVAGICQRLSTRLEALQALQAVEVEVIGRRKGAEVRLRLLAGAEVNIPELVEQVSHEVQDEVETRLGVRLLQQHCLILHPPANRDKPSRSQPAPDTSPAPLRALVKRGE
jgi:MFS family permease